MSVIYAAVMGLFIVLAVVVGAIQCRTRNWLVAFMGFLAVYSGLILLDSFDVRISPTAYFLLLSFTFLPGPLILGYVSHISTREEVHLKDFTFCLLPIVIALFCSDLLGGFPLFALVPREAYEIESYIMMFNLVSAMAGIHLLVYLARASHLILKMKRDWTAYQSRTLPESWYDMIKVLLVMVIANGTQVLSAFMHPTGQEISIGDLGFMILVVHFVYLSARVMFRSKQAEGQDDDVIYEERVYLVPRPEPASDLLQDAQRIEKIISDESSFLDAELSLPSLAEKVGVSPHRLSEVLNSGFQKSFYEYINDLRVDYAAKLLISAPDKSVTEVFYTAGFSNKSTFYGYFKKTYSATPSSYRKQFSNLRSNSTPEKSVVVPFSQNG
jgi:AraC-like DNA-binding protein